MVSMTPELRQDIRYVAQALLDTLPDRRGEAAGVRVLAWLDAEERLHTPIMPMDEDVDTEFTWLDASDHVW